MKGFILAAGFGQRMLPITATLPKPLLPLLGTPLIEYSIALLKQAGITDLVINVHHLARTLMDALGDGSRLGCTITYSHETEILGTGGALKKMHHALDDTFVLINSDIVIDVDLRQVIESHRQRRAQATMVLRTPDESQQHVGRIGIDRQGRVVQILGQKMVSGADGGEPWPKDQELMFTGVHVIEPTFVDYIPNNLHSDIIRYGYFKALANGAPLAGFVCDGFWADAGTPETFWAAHEAMLQNPSRLGHIKPLRNYRLHPRRDVRDTVCMGEGVHLGDGAQLQPPVLMGDGVKLFDGAAVGPMTVLGDQVQVGKNSVLKRSVVLSGTKVAPGAVYDGMMLGPDGALQLLP